MTYFITKLANAKKNSDIKKPLSAVTGSGRYSQIMEPMNENNFNRNRNESKDFCSLVLKDFKEKNKLDSISYEAMSFTKNYLG